MERIINWGLKVGVVGNSQAGRDKRPLGSLWRFAFWAMAVLTIGSGALRAEPPETPDESESPSAFEQTIPPEQVAELAGTAEIEQTPKGLAITTRAGSHYEFQASPGNQEQTDFFNGLSEPERDNFKKNRAFILQVATSLLDRARMPIGFFQKKVAPLFGRKKAETGVPDPNASPVVSTPQGTMREMGKETVQKLLSTLDSELWRNSPLLARANELGVSPEGGVAGGAKFGSWGFMGVTGVGVTMSVDHKGKVIVFELYQDIDWAKRADPFYIGLGAFVTFTGSAAHHDWKKPLRIEKGHAFCVPGLVGCVTPNNMRIGISKEIGVGAPGIVAIHSHMYRIPLARLGISPNFLGFVRVQTLLGTAVRSTLARTCDWAMGWLGRKPASVPPTTAGEVTNAE